MALPTYHVIRLPKLPNLTGGDSRQLAEKFRELRLLALKTAPECFASSYEVELEADLPRTVERLNDNQATQFVALQGAPNLSDALTDLFDTRWVGMIVLIGPLALPISAQSDPLTQARSAVDSGRYHLNGVFVHPDMRRTGIGRALIAAALDKGKMDSTERGKEFSCTIMVDSENSAGEELYKGFGFRVTGTETYVQQGRSSSSHASKRTAKVLELPSMDGSEVSSS